MPAIVVMYTIAASLRRGRPEATLKVSADRDGSSLDGSAIDHQEQRARRRFIAS